MRAPCGDIEAAWSGWGRGDPPAIIAAGIPGARLRVVPGSGHQVALERPAELGRAVLAL